METEKVLIGGTEFTVLPVTVRKHGLWHRINLGAWEAHTINFVKNNTGKVFFDIGAWIGPITLLASTRFEKVIAFEPSKEAAKALRKNIKLNGIKNVTVVNKAMHNYLGEADFGYNGNLGFESSRSSLNFRSEESYKVKTITLKEAIKRYGKPDFIKIDIEGGEEYVIDSIIEQVPKCLSLSLHPKLINDFEVFIVKLAKFTKSPLYKAERNGKDYHFIRV